MEEKNLEESLKKSHSEMTREELLYALEWEKAMLERTENALMLPDSTDESLELAKPLLKVIEESIKEIKEILEDKEDGLKGVKR